MNKNLRKNSLIVLIVALVLSVVLSLTLGFVNVKPASAYTCTIMYGSNGAIDKNRDHWTAQGNNVSGQAGGGKWYFGYGDVAENSVSFVQSAVSNSAFTFSAPYDCHGFWYGYKLKTAKYANTSKQSMIKWTAESDGYVKFGGVIAKFLQSGTTNSLVSGFNPASGTPHINFNWGDGDFTWYDGASYTIGMWKSNGSSASHALKIEEMTYTSAFAYSVNEPGAKIAVKAGDSIYFTYKCNANATGENDHANVALCLLSSEFTENTYTTAYEGDDIFDLTNTTASVAKMTGQGVRSAGETSGYWNYKFGTISSSAYSVMGDLVYQTSKPDGDSHRYLASGYSNMICWGVEASCNTRYATIYEWNAEAGGNLRLGGVVTKGHSDKGGLIGLTGGYKYYNIPATANGANYKWFKGDSYTVGIYKVSGSTVTVISEKTFTSEYAYLIPSSAIAVARGDKVVVALKANTTVGGDWSTNHFMAVDAKFTQDLDLGMSITKNMILQQNKNVNIWGTGAPGKTVTVSIDDQVKTATIDNNGDWIVQLDPMKATFTAKTMTITDGSTTKELTGILVGEVWMTSGQSNMAYTFLELLRDRGYTPDNMTAEEIYATPMFKDWTAYADNYKNVRIFTPGYAQKASPDKTGTDAYWVNETYGWGKGANIKDWYGHSVYGLGFALRLQQKLGVPVGFINVAVGGSSIEEWISNETYTTNNYTLHQNPTAKPVSQLYNGMMYPVKNATINGFMWYQGCADSQSVGSTMADDWAKKMVGFVAQVRSEHGNIPFVSQSLVQNYGWQPVQYMRNLNWNLQYQIENFYPVNGIAAGYAYDTVRPTNTTANDIHPADKFGISKDAANIALNYVYGYKDCMGIAAYPTKVYRQGTNVIIDYGALDKDSNNKLVLTSGTTVNNLQALDTSTSAWVTVTNATVSDNKIIIPNATKYSYVAYAQYSIMASDALTNNRVDHKYDYWYSDKPVNLFSANGVAAAPFAGMGVYDTNYSTGVSLLAKQDFTMQYTFTIKKDTQSPVVTFAYNGRYVDVPAVLNADGLTYTASFSGIAPQDLNDGVTVDKITVTDKNGSKTALALNSAKATDFSVQDYLLALKAVDSSASTQKLIVNMLNYGAAAQTYLGHDTANLANASLSDSDKTNYSIAFDANTLNAGAVRSATGTSSTLARFRGAQAWFDNQNGMKLVFSVDDSIKDKATLKITNTKGLDLTIAIADCQVEKYNGENVYTYKLENISITNYTTAYTFQIMNDGVAEGYALNYNMYGYMNSIINGSTNANYVALVKALYSYSQAVLGI